MKKSRNRLLKMQNFQKQERRIEEIEPISKTYKYELELIGRTRNEDVQRIKRGPQRPQHI